MRMRNTDVKVYRNYVDIYHASALSALQTDVILASLGLPDIAKVAERLAGFIQNSFGVVQARIALVAGTPVLRCNTFSQVNATTIRLRFELYYGEAVSALRGVANHVTDSAGQAAASPALDPPLASLTKAFAFSNGVTSGTAAAVSGSASHASVAAMSLAAWGAGAGLALQQNWVSMQIKG